MLKNLINKIDKMFEKAELILDRSNTAIEELRITVKELKETACMPHMFIKEAKEEPITVTKKPKDSRLSADYDAHVSPREKEEADHDERVERNREALIRAGMIYKVEKKNLPATGPWQTGPAPKGDLPILGVFYGYPHVVILDGNRWCLYGDTGECWKQNLQCGLISISNFQKIKLNILQKYKRLANPNFFSFNP